MKCVFLFLLFLLLSSTSFSREAQYTSKLSGHWLMNIVMHNGGALAVAMTFEGDNTLIRDTLHFYAYSEKGMDKHILGNLKAKVGRMAGTNFKNGSLLRISDGTLSVHDSLHGIFVSPFGNFYIKALFTKGSINGALINAHGETVGSIEGSHGLPNMPLRNYEAIMDSVLNVAEARLYDPALVKTHAWINFNREMKRISTITGDDAALVMAFFYFSRKLPFSHFSFYRPSADLKSAASATTDEPKVTLTEKTHQTALLKISSFTGTAGEMDTAFEQIARADYRNLIVDLRGNPGGFIDPGMAFAQHLIPDTIYGGVFLTRKYFAEHQTIPVPSEYHLFPHFSEANYPLFLQGIHEYPAICLQAYPKQPVFKGRIFILTDGQTASTCEPLVYTIKQHHLATIVGSKTAGAMLNGETFSFGDGFSMTLPTATYYATDGFKIDQQGVTPDIATDENALDYVLNKLSTVHD